MSMYVCMYLHLSKDSVFVMDTLGTHEETGEVRALHVCEGLLNVIDLAHIHTYMHT